MYANTRKRGRWAESILLPPFYPPSPFFPLPQNTGRSTWFGSAWIHGRGDVERYVPRLIPFFFFFLPSFFSLPLNLSIGFRKASFNISFTSPCLFLRCQSHRVPLFFPPFFPSPSLFSPFRVCVGCSSVHLIGLITDTIIHIIWTSLVSSVFSSFRNLKGGSKRALLDMLEVDGCVIYGMNVSDILTNVSGSSLPPPFSSLSNGKLMTI